MTKFKVFLCFIISISCGAVYAESITVNFEGELRYVYGTLPQEALGTTISGEYTFDPSLENPRDGTLVVNQYSNALTNITFSTNGDAEGSANGGRIDIQNQGAGFQSAYTIYGLAGLAGASIDGIMLSQISFNFVDESGVAITSTQLTSIVPDINLFDQFSIVQIEFGSQSNANWGLAAFDLTFLSVDPSHTGTGEDVNVTPIAYDENGVPTDSSPVEFVFDNVDSAGDTQVVVSNSGTPTPFTFKTGNPPVYYYLETTASFTGSINICIDYTGTSYSSEANARLLHFTGSGWEDITSSLNIEDNIICGLTTSLSPFTIVESSSPTEMITGLMYEVISLNLKKGISNSMDVKLNSATSALTDAKSQNDLSAINMLNAFINSVEAQRGKEIADIDADDLISKAMQIIDSLE